MTSARSRERVRGQRAARCGKAEGPAEQSRAQQRDGVRGRRSRRPGLEASCAGCWRPAKGAPARKLKSVTVAESLSKTETCGMAGRESRTDQPDQPADTADTRGLCAQWGQRRREDGSEKGRTGLPTDQGRPGGLQILVQTVVLQHGSVY